MSHTRPIDTDLILTADARAKLQDKLVEEDGCLFYPRAAIEVRLRGGLRAQICPSRLAWAIANPHDHLGPDDLAVHTCKSGIAYYSGHTDNPKICCDPDHLRKGTTADVTAFRRARKLQGAL